MKVMDTYKHVRNAFYSGEHAFNGDRQIIQDIAFLVDEQYLLLRVFPIASHQEYLAILHNLEKNKRSDDAAGGGNEHIALKILSGEHLQKSLGLKVLYEHPLCGYYPDVITTDNSIVSLNAVIHTIQKRCSLTSDKATLRNAYAFRIRTLMNKMLQLIHFLLQKS